VIRVDTIDQLFDSANLLANQPIPIGERVGVITNAGGPGILAADALEANGLVLPELSAELREQIGSVLPAEASTRNPVDLIASGGPTEYEHVTSLLLESGEVDAVMVIYIPVFVGGAQKVAEALHRSQLAYEGAVTLLSVFMQTGEDAAHYLAGKDGARAIPTYMFPESAALALARAVRHGQWRHRDPGNDVPLGHAVESELRALVERALETMPAEGGWLDPDLVGAVLETVGLHVPRSSVVTSAKEAVKAAEELGGPVVLKVISESALHKSDVGGVALDVEGESRVKEAYKHVTQAVDDAEGVLLQEFVRGGHEVLIGMTQDPNFGPLVVFGLGGIYVELLQDVAFRIHPLTDVDASEMIKEIKGSRLLDGYRNQPKGDMAALEEALLKVSGLIDAVPELVEMDLNPVKVLEPGGGVVVVDARMKIRALEATKHPRMRDLPGVTS
jgi:acyl-CoA synthetase (NDP forming)